MKNEERNDKLDTIREWVARRGQAWIPIAEKFADAIFDCDRKARAWDELEQFAAVGRDAKELTDDYRDFWGDVCGKMAELLAPPKPKSKLEMIKQHALKTSFERAGMVVVHLKELLDELERLEKEPD